MIANSGTQANVDFAAEEGWATASASPGGVATHAAEDNENREQMVGPAATQQIWAALLVEELVRQGVGLFVIAPGSRSTPLALAVARNSGARHLIHFDERGGAFAALGFARATNKPAVWITTSGTAAANGLPAVIEADADGVPLVLLTADRPPELRDTGANQTIRQPGIFGEFVRWQFDLPVPDASIAPAFVLTTIAQAVFRSLKPAGPVHLNCMLREPFDHPGEQSESPEIPAALQEWLQSGRPFTTYPLARGVLSPGEAARLASILEQNERGLMVLGKSDRPADAAAARHLAEILGWPLLADVASGCRLGDAKAVSYDVLLDVEPFCRDHQPDVVLHLGGRVASKRLQAFVEQARPRHHIVVRADAARYDPGHGVSQRICMEIDDFCHAISAEIVEFSQVSEWTQAWRKASRAANDTIDRVLSARGLTEPGVARAVSRLTREGNGLLVASSMPVRDLDAFAASDGPRLRVTANRGASGIDGLVATAAGFALGAGRPTTLLIGDLALLHDLNSLALLRPRDGGSAADIPPIVVVAINNDGGGIFNFLPIAGQADVFESFFGTPHGLRFGRAADMFGLTYANPTTPGEFEVAYAAALERNASTLIEVNTDRRENVMVHRSLLAEVREAVQATRER